MSNSLPLVAIESFVGGRMLSTVFVPGGYATSLPGTPSAADFAGT